MKKVLITVGMAVCMNIQAQIITTVCGNGTQGYSGDGTAATAAELYAPQGISIDAVGNLYIADQGNQRIRKINTAGIISTFAGGGSGGDGGQATSAVIYSPQNTAFDASGNLYISEFGSRIRMVNTSGIITTIAGNGTQGYSGDGGQATAAEINQPIGIALDAAGNLYIADYSNNLVRKVNTSGIISTFAGNGTIGYTGDGAQATAAELWYPTGVACDAAGNLYIVDQSNLRIRKVNTAGIISTIAGGGTSGLGDGGNATAAQLANPNGVAFDATGNLYIADGNSRIRMVNTAGIISTIAGTATYGYSGDGGQATSAELYAPQGVTLDTEGNLYIVDMGNNRIRMVSNCSIIPTVSYTLTADIAPHTWDAYPTYSSNVVNARWYWGDGTDTMALYPSHTYSVGGTYSICVAAYSVCGDSAVSCQNDAVTRLGNNSPYSSMVYVNVLNGNQTTGIATFNTQHLAFQIYPNPAKDVLNVVCLMVNEIGNISITDMLGNTIYHSTFTTQNNTISVADLSAGVYMVQITTDKVSEIKKIVKQ